MVNKGKNEKKDSDLHVDLVHIFHFRPCFNFKHCT